MACPIDILRSPSLAVVLGTPFVPTVPSVAPRSPFVPHNQVGTLRICMPTIVSWLRHVGGWLPSDVEQHGSLLLCPPLKGFGRQKCLARLATVLPRRSGRP